MTKNSLVKKKTKTKKKNPFVQFIDFFLYKNRKQNKQKTKLKLNKAKILYYKKKTTPPPPQSGSGGAHLNCSICEAESGSSL